MHSAWPSCGWARAAVSSSLVGLTLGTGVGGVIAIDGQVHLGHDGTAGEVGHQTIDPDGPLCGCGNHGCLEAFARADRLAAACGTATVEDAVEAARTGDARALAGFAEIGRYLGHRDREHGRGVLPGPGRDRRWDRRWPSTCCIEAIREELRLRVQTTSLAEVEVVPAELGTWAGSIGAAIHGAEAAAVRDPAGGAARGGADSATLAVSERHA